MATINSPNQVLTAWSEPELTANALTVLKDRYLMRDDNGHTAETPAELFRRVAQTIAAVESNWGTSAEDTEQLARQFYDLLASRRFLPNSPTLMNAGRPLGMLSACFVLPLEDSIPDIMETARQTALVQRAGGGTGIDLSQLRPKGSIVRSSGGTTDGPLSFLRMLSGVTDAIQQGAFRRGANMGIMRIDHPDILAFIDLKTDLTQVTNYNLSVTVTDDFMRAICTDRHQAHVVRNPHTGLLGRLVRTTGQARYGEHPDALAADNVTVGEIWERIVDRAWRSGDPGLVFIDEVNRHNPTPHLGPIRATNPCGEQPLRPYEACNLGSVNLAAFFRPDADSRSDDSIHWSALRETVELAVRFLDNVIDANKYPTREIHDATHMTRKIGLGVMGFADLLFMMRLAYDSDDALELAQRLGQTIRDTAWVASERLAEIRGNFPMWEGSIWQTQHDNMAIRNAQLTTIAPTGTISIIAGCSSGIEPVFSLAFQRQVLGGKKLLEVNPVFQAALRPHFHDEAKVAEILEHAAAYGSVQAHREVPRELKAVFRTARDISPSSHVRMQAAWQRHTDAAVSKTINLPADASTRDVEQAFLLAHQLKCKGITVYRDGARPLQPMALAPRSTDPEKSPASRAARPVKLPEIIPSVRLRQTTPFGNMHLHISVDPETGREREVFAQLGKGGDLANSDLEAICRLISLLLRLDGDVQMVIDQLEGIGSSLSVPSKDGRIKSLGDGLAHALGKYMAMKQRDGLDAILSGRVKTLDESEATRASIPTSDQEAIFKIKCPDCDLAGTLAFEEGCLKCHACGYCMC
ncbi:MAG: adenosylcobalamin-dependent ribonucleoside-diphosphate reductase [Pirellulaceae bacterium]